MLSSHFIGEITEQQVGLAFLRLGILLSKPLVQSSKYDFVADVNNQLYKIQVKTSALEEEGNYFSFATSTSHTNTKGTVNLHYSPEEVDYFATICNEQCYLIPYELCGTRNQRIRLQPTKNGQVKGILFAKDFKLEDMIEKM